MGSGNNWAYGFNHHGPSSSQDILEKLNQMLEKCDMVDGLMLW